MPIKRLAQDAQPAFPRLGKLRKGGERSEEDKRRNRPGKELAFWRFTSDRPEVATAFTAAYGEHPALINVYLPYPTVEQNFQCWQEAWVQGGLQHRCDGETTTILLLADGKYSTKPHQCPGGCKEVGRLIVMIPELLEAGFVGYVTAETHGINDLLSIQGSLLAAEQARAGTPLGLRGIRWTLRRQAEQISTPGENGKRVRRQKYLVKIEPAADWMQLQLQAARQQQMGMLEAPKVGVEYLNQRTGEVSAKPPTDVVEGEVIELEAEPPTEDYDSAIPPADEAPDPDLPEPDGADESVSFEEDTKRQRRGEIRAIYDRNKWNWDIFLSKFAKTYETDFEQANLTQLDNALESIRRPRQQAAS